MTEPEAPSDNVKLPYNLPSKRIPPEKFILPRIFIVSSIRVSIA
jgi:hypothetical protein